MPEVRIPAFAKINLRLDVLGKREDGFHELRTIFQTISLQDELRLRASRSEGTALSIEGNQPLSAEPVEKNLVYRAVDALRRALGVNKGDEIYPLPDIAKRHVLVVSPWDIHVPTPDAYGWLNAKALRLTKSAANPKLWEFCTLCWSAQGSGLSNDFEEPVFWRHPRLDEL